MGCRLRRRGCGDGGGPARAAPGQGRVLPEHRRLDVAQLGAGLEAELGVEDVADLAQRLERVRLAARPGQRDGAQAPEPFAERVRRGERLELGGRGPVVTQGQGGDRPVLEGDAAQLLEPGPLRHRGGGVLELDVRDPAPERQRLVQLLRGRRELVVGEGGWRPEGGPLADPPVHVADGPVEACGVEGAVGQVQGVAGRDGDQDGRGRARGAVRFQRASQPGDVDLERAGHPVGW